MPCAIAGAAMPAVATAPAAPTPAVFRNFLRLMILSCAMRPSSSLSLRSVRLGGTAGRRDLAEIDRGSKQRIPLGILWARMALAPIPAGGYGAARSTRDRG